MTVSKKFLTFIRFNTGLLAMLPRLSMPTLSASAASG